MVPGAVLTLDVNAGGKRLGAVGVDHFAAQPASLGAGTPGGRHGEGDEGKEKDGAAMYRDHLASPSSAASRHEMVAIASGRLCPLAERYLSWCSRRWRTPRPAPPWGRQSYPDTPESQPGRPATPADRK